jgi:AhpD family alkylhydroperoxidase
MERLDYRQIGAKSWRSLGLMAKSVDDGALDHGLLELVKLRASQINGCANCVNLHANRLREDGATEEIIQNVVVWWEAKCFDKRTKAALEWTDSVTLVSETRVPDDVYERVIAVFSEAELVDLTFAICTINVHNRLAVAFRRSPGS